MPVEIAFETHSISEDNERGIATGWLPGRLSERGRGLARELGARQRRDRLAAIFSSGLTRAVEIVAIAFAGTELPVRADRRPRECDYGQLNGAAVERVAPRSRFITTPFPGGETGRALEDLVDAPFAWQPGWLYRMT